MKKKRSNPLNTNKTLAKIIYKKRNCRLDTLPKNKQNQRNYFL